MIGIEMPRRFSRFMFWPPYRYRSLRRPSTPLCACPAQHTVRPAEPGIRYKTAFSDFSLVASGLGHPRHTAMARPFPTDNPLLQGGFEPIRMECDNADLFVHGEIPSELIGTLYRIGPNPQFAPRGRYNPLQADGMIHAFH